MTNTVETTTVTKTNYYFRVSAAIAAAVMVAMLMASAAKPAQASGGTRIVNSTADPGDGKCDATECTLREAINSANSSPGLDVINFNIPGSGVHTIKLGSFLAVLDPVIIDGYSQPGAQENTLEQGDNAEIKIELDGSGAGDPGIGLIIGQSAGPVNSGNTIRGLAINNFKENGIRVGTPQNKVEGNFIGTDAGGFIARPNTNAGVLIEDPGNIVGGERPDQRNVISGNFGGGVEIRSDGSDFNHVLNNFIGTDKSGASSLGNGFDGVSIERGASSNTIGSATPASANTIAFNQGAGVSVSDDSATNGIASNSVFSNSGLGIDLNRDSGGPRDGVTANDTGDGDPGPNEPGPNFLQNFPELTFATTFGSQTFVSGKLNSLPNKTFKLQFFSSPEADPSGNGEGKTFLGEKSVTTGSDANASFTFTAPTVVPAGNFVAATATDPAGDTSEFSKAVKVNQFVPRHKKKRHHRH